MKAPGSFFPSPNKSKGVAAAFLAAALSVGSIPVLADDVARGTGSTATGTDATATGNYANAANDFTFAIGDHANASGTASMAFGTMNGPVNTQAAGANSFAFGSGAIASQPYSFSFGLGTSAAGANSVAIGQYAQALGISSLAIGYFDPTAAWPHPPTANGDFSAAIGSGSFAQWGQFVIGQYNVPQGSPSSAAPSDNLFVIGNGYVTSTRNDDGYFPVVQSNAFTVQWNGDTHIAGNLYVAGALAVTSGNISGAFNGSTSLVLGPGSSSVSTGYSVAIGSNVTTAIDDGKGDGRVYDEPSVALGNSVSTMGGSVALGSGISPSGNAQSNCVQVGINLGMDGYSTTGATVVGVNSRAGGNNATSVGYGDNAAAAASSAVGYMNLTGDDSSSAFGYMNTAAASGSSAFGFANTAAGAGSSAFGHMNMTSGNLSTAIGSGAVTTGYEEVVVGSNNIVDTSQTIGSWVPTDNIFVVGNGAPPIGDQPATYSDALVVQKNGNTTFYKDVTVQGSFHAPKQGDISMGQFAGGS